MLAIVPELHTIRMALKHIDFQLRDEDRNDFYIYAVNDNIPLVTKRHLFVVFHAFQTQVFP